MNKLKTLPPQAKKSRISFECPVCGPQDHLLFDAGTLLEREFEGVDFLVKSGPVVAGKPEDAEYLDRFNMDKWLKEGLECAEDEPGRLRCPKCQEELGE